VPLNRSTRQTQEFRSKRHSFPTCGSRGLRPQVATLGIRQQGAGFSREPRRTDLRQDGLSASYPRWRSRLCAPSSNTRPSSRSVLFNVFKGTSRRILGQGRQTLRSDIRRRVCCGRQTTLPLQGSAPPWKRASGMLNNSEPPPRHDWRGFRRGVARWKSDSRHEWCG
jgi:hypothetical protein